MMKILYNTYKMLLENIHYTTSKDGCNMIDSEKDYLEYGLPTYLEDSKQKFIAGEEKYKQGDYTLFDGDYCEFQSDINVAEVNGDISSEQAWYLREKYLGIMKEDI